ncbi:MAG TPA: RimK/LysX family protein [Candidatus Saccharimonadales bacterium]|nr:RimK/LysX family protein [Candidatus Saccharimonadales bacterium]
MKDTTQPVTIGRTEEIYLPGYIDQAVIAKVDTGADVSSIWASGIHKLQNKLEFRLFAPGSPYYTGTVITLPRGEYSLKIITNSFGQRESRYSVKLRIKLAGRTVRASFTLADRSQMAYPILLGKRLLRGKFVVDVSRGAGLSAGQ